MKRVRCRNCVDTLTIPFVSTPPPCPSCQQVDWYDGPSLGAVEGFPQSTFSAGSTVTVDLQTHSLCRCPNCGTTHSPGTSVTLYTDPFDTDTVTLEAPRKAHPYVRDTDD